ncbi:Acidic phosphoprotein precursor PCEMA1, putative [Plasmodium chabaudi adami]|uniref:Acidic phosphoprotein PCEMA1, putative n=1 Tax=Plasmodium chabaudi adami TaxID=5826 RepID=A0A1D3L9T7_PLACE|nr:Acidic phosphoprotein precursor PCEMA1, putative [Plasmodium chabaudi adami]
MKIISLGLISSIIFSIVLAKNSSDSGPTTGCFPFCRKKTKKIHKINEPVKVEIKGKGTYDPDIPDIKFIDESDPIIFEAHEECQTRLSELFTSETDGTTVDEVTGFLRRENESIAKGWYIRPYEEDYEDIIEANCMPPKNNYQPFQPNQKNIHKQGCTSLAIPNGPENQELSTVDEDEYVEIRERASAFKVMLPGLGMMFQGAWVDGVGLKIQGLWGDLYFEHYIR